MNWKRYGRRDRDLISSILLPHIAWPDWGKLRKPPVRVPGLRGKIWGRHASYTKKNCYSFKPHIFRGLSWSFPVLLVEFQEVSWNRLQLFPQTLHLVARIISYDSTLSNSTVVAVFLNNWRPNIAVLLEVQIAVDLLSKFTQSIRVIPAYRMLTTCCVLAGLPIRILEMVAVRSSETSSFN
jgi:hypothetical protein